MNDSRRFYAAVLVGILFVVAGAQGDARPRCASAREQASTTVSSAGQRDSNRSGAASTDADVSGEWAITGTKREDPDPHELTMVLKQQQDKFSGTLTTNKGQFEVKDGRVRGAEISFSISMPEASMTAACSGSVTGDALKATCQFPNSTIDLAGSRHKKSDK